MIKLSDRLNMIAEEIERGETMADIGTEWFLAYLFNSKRNFPLCCFRRYKRADSGKIPRDGKGIFESKSE